MLMFMKVSELSIAGCYLIEPKRILDNRGGFVKTYHYDFFKSRNINFELKEEFYSCSNENVIRGMHFQMVPADHEKMVYCPKGAVLDVILDLRKNSSTFGDFLSFELNEENLHQLYISKGIAHGFLSISDGTLMMYKTSSVHSPAHDMGIRWDSFGFDWGVCNPLVSERDSSLPNFDALMDYF